VTWPACLDPIEKLVVEGALDIGDAAGQQPEIDQHAGQRIRGTAQGDLGAKRMAMDFLAGLTERRVGQRMRGFKTEGFGQFPHDLQVQSSIEYRASCASAG
jgi:hypothetical protein